jgi:mono/diheme cytochrome c family protein
MTVSMIRPLAIVLGLALWTATLAVAAPPPSTAKPDPRAAEARAWAAAKPVLDKYCAGCHTQGAKAATKRKLGHFDMTSYPLGGHHAATIGTTLRGVLGITGQKPRMPADRPGIVAGDELAAVRAWTEAWDAADKAGLHPPAAHH